MTQIKDDRSNRNSPGARSSYLESAVPAEMVTAYIETLIERLTGVKKAEPDADGDYPIRYRSALYYVRVVGSRMPVVQVFSVAVDGTQFTDALARDLNAINAQLHFCRIFWVLDQVLVESEHLGPTITAADFDESAFNVAEATDAFAKGLADSHGGRLRVRRSQGARIRLPSGRWGGILPISDDTGIQAACSFAASHLISISCRPLRPRRPCCTCCYTGALPAPGHDGQARVDGPHRAQTLPLVID